MSEKLFYNSLYGKRDMQWPWERDITLEIDFSPGTFTAELNCTSHGVFVSYSEMFDVKEGERSKLSLLFRTMMKEVMTHVIEHHMGYNPVLPIRRDENE